MQHGIPWELCEKAKQSSLVAVSKGFPASFPDDRQCANVSYAGPDKSYNHAVSLTAGAHTLWTGMMMEVRLRACCVKDFQHITACLSADSDAQSRLAAGVD